MLLFFFLLFVVVVVVVVVVLRHNRELLTYTQPSVLNDNLRYKLD